LRIVENAYIQIHNTILNGYNNNLASALCWSEVCRDAS
jgi:hypothetical protein